MRHFFKWGWPWKTDCKNYGDGWLCEKEHQNAYMERGIIKTITKDSKEMFNSQDESTESKSVCQPVCDRDRLGNHRKHEDSLKSQVESVRAHMSDQAEPHRVWKVLVYWLARSSLAEVTKLLVWNNELIDLMTLIITQKSNITKDRRRPWNCISNLAPRLPR